MTVSHRVRCLDIAFDVRALFWKIQQKTEGGENPVTGNKIYSLPEGQSKGP